MKFIIVALNITFSIISIKLLIYYIYELALLRKEGLIQFLPEQYSNVDRQDCFYYQSEFFFIDTLIYTAVYFSIVFLQKLRLKSKITNCVVFHFCLIFLFFIHSRIISLFNQNYQTSNEIINFANRCIIFQFTYYLIATVAIGLIIFNYIRGNKHLWNTS
jgi:hypothetical protein